MPLQTKDSYSYLREIAINRKKQWKHIFYVISLFVKFHKLTE
jgi:hypothetical protein